MIARATISRWAMPPDSASTGAVGPVGEPELLEQPVGLGAWPSLRGHAEEAAVEVEVLPHGQRPVERVGLRHDADHLLGRGRVARRRRCRRRAPRPLVGIDPGREHARGRGLAGAVRAEQAEDLAPVARRGRARRRRGCRPGTPWSGRGSRSPAARRRRWTRVAAVRSVRVIVCSSAGSGTVSGGPSASAPRTWARACSKSLSSAPCITAASSTLMTARISSSQRAITVWRAARRAAPAAVRVRRITRRSSASRLRTTRPSASSRSM